MSKYMVYIIIALQMTVAARSKVQLCGPSSGRIVGPSVCYQLCYGAVVLMCLMFPIDSENSVVFQLMCARFTSS
jgi:hypothetical protein